MVATDHDRRADIAVRHELVEPFAGAVAFSVAEPADPRGEPLERHPLLGHPQPPLEAFVLWEELAHRPVGREDVGGVARERRPAERPLPFAEEGSDEGRDEPRVRVRAIVVESAQLGAGPQVVPVVERDGAGRLEVHHRIDVGGHARVRTPDVVVGVVASERRRLVQRESARDIPTERVVRARLVGDDVGPPPATDKFGQHVGAVAEQPDRDRLTVRLRLVGPRDRGVDVVRLAVEVAGLDPTLDPASGRPRHRGPPRRSS